MNIINVRVFPKTLRNGKYVLYERTTYDERVPGLYGINRSRIIVWPPSKLPNKRGMQFDTKREAMAYYDLNKEVAA